VHRITGFDYGRDWADGEARETTIVIIGRRLDEAAIRAGFQLACR
jgi:G3E family GTPase